MFAHISKETFHRVFIERQNHGIKKNRNGNYLNVYYTQLNFTTDLYKLHYKFYMYRRDCP